mmetsp:Transcript_45492/g.74313  ORF Transcript_45492/g.74313 Transcript_45492/m.74313 type:complete len:86 (+) Transcript_45492:26-283(+)
MPTKWAGATAWYPYTTRALPALAWAARLRSALRVCMHNGVGTVRVPHRMWDGHGTKGLFALDPSSCSGLTIDIQATRRRLTINYR